MKIGGFLFCVGLYLLGLFGVLLDGCRYPVFLGAAVILFITGFALIFHAMQYGSSSPVDPSRYNRMEQETRRRGEPGSGQDPPDGVINDLSEKK